jgi:OmpA-OmpF porin, OOP family
MAKPILIVFIAFLSTFTLFCQNQCVKDKEGNCIAKGNYKTIEQKTSYGTKLKSKLRTGKWEFLNEDGQIVSTGNYKIYNKSSYKEGVWSFFNDEGKVLLKRSYKLDQIIDFQILDSGLYVYQTDTISISNNQIGSTIVTETRNNIRFTYETILAQTKSGDPYLNAKKTEYQISTQYNYKKETDDLILSKYPSINQLLVYDHWPVNSDRNIVNNGDFEANSDKIKEQQFTQIKFNNDELATDWGSSNETPDICKIKENTMAGFRVFGVNYEVLRNKLKQTLTANKTYCLQFKIKLRIENKFGINGISVILSEDIQQFKNSQVGLEFGVAVQSHPSIILGLREQWMTISGTFKAKGGENYLYIGNFTSEKTLKIQKLDGSAPDYSDEIYYFIDDVVLVELNENEKCPCNIQSCDIEGLEKPMTNRPIVQRFNQKPKIGQTIILENILFETAKSELLSESFPTLDSLFLLLANYPEMNIEIAGHTDNKGSIENNMKLSQDRANAVLVYLMDKGIDENRMIAQGYGSSEPIETNETEEGRLKNRRVAFKILKI